MPNPLDSEDNKRRIRELEKENTHLKLQLDSIQKNINLKNRDLINSEKELLQTRKMEAIDTLAGGIAHDFNNILGIILGNTEMALESTDPESIPFECLTNTRTACLRAKELIQQIINFSRKPDTHPETINISEIVSDALKLIRSSFPSSIKIETDIETYAGNILAHKSQINQILLNLCTNAKQAMDNKGILKIKLSKFSLIKGQTHKLMNKLTPGNYVKLSISDNGSGINKEIIDRIFDPYFTTKQINTGAGMGLTIVYNIVKNYNGFIDLESEVNKGTTFNIFLPLYINKTGPQSVVFEGKTSGTESVLFVDDEEMLNRIMTQLIVDKGYKIKSYTDPLKALDFFKLNPDYFDIVITDMTLPSMSGSKLADEIIKVRPDIPIILCSGYSDLINENTSKEYGIKKFLLKPVKSSILFHSIRELLDNK